MKTNRTWIAPVLIGVAALMLTFWTCFAVFLPMSRPYIEWVLDPDWLWINILGFTGSLLSVFAMVGLFGLIADRSKLAQFGAGLSISGAIIMTSILYFEAFILKGIAIEAPELIEIGKGFFAFTAFNASNFIGGVFLSTGVGILAVRLESEHRFSRWKLIFLTVGTPLFSIVFVPPNLRLLGVVLFATSLMAMGVEPLLRPRLN